MLRIFFIYFFYMTRVFFVENNNLVVSEFHTVILHRMITVDYLEPMNLKQTHESCRFHKYENTSCRIVTKHYKVHVEKHCDEKHIERI